MHEGRGRGEDDDVGEAGAETDMGARAVRCEHAGPAMLGAGRKETVDVEATRLLKVPRVVMRSGRSDDEPRAGGNGETRKVERVDDGAHNRRGDRKQTQGLQHDAVTDIEPAQDGRRERTGRKRGIGVSLEATEQHPILQQCVYKEGEGRGSSVEARDIGTQEGQAEIGLREKGGVRGVQGEQVVDQVRGPTGTIRRIVGASHTPREREHRAPGTTEGRQAQQKAGTLTCDPHSQEGTNERGQLGQVLRGRQPGQKDTELLGDNRLHLFEDANRGIYRPGRHAPARNGNDVVKAMMSERARVRTAHGAPETGMLRTVHADQGTTRAELGVEVRPEVLRAQVHCSAPRNKQIGLGASYHNEPPSERADGENRPQELVLTGEKAADVAGKGKGMAGNRPCRRGRKTVRRRHDQNVALAKRRAGSAGTPNMQGCGRTWRQVARQIDAAWARARGGAAISGRTYDRSGTWPRTGVCPAWWYQWADGRQGSRTGASTTRWRSSPTARCSARRGGAGAGVTARREGATGNKLPGLNP